MAEEQEIKIGQIWRRKKSGKLIRIERHYSSMPGIDADDWHWQGHDYKGRGVSYGWYIRRDCELVTDV